MQEKLSTIKLLITNGIDLSIKYEKKQSIWKFAKSLKNREIEKILQEGGAELWDKTVKEEEKKEEFSRGLHEYT